MAHNMRALYNIGKGVLSNALCRNTVLNARNRNMFTEAALKIDLYQKERHLIRSQYIAVEDTFREKMKSICDSERGKIYMEDLKAMLYIAQEDDIPLLMNMIEKYSMYQSNTRFIFGPVVMRTLYFLDSPKAVQELLEKPGMACLWETQSAQTIAMTLFYNHAMYSDVVQMWEKISSQNIETPAGIKSTRILTFAALAKEGTPEAYEKAKALWEKMKAQEVYITREMSLYLYLLLQTNHADEILDVLETTRYFPQTYHHFKISALLQLNRYNDIPPVMENMLDEIGERRSFLCKDLHKAIRALPDTVEAKERIENLFRALPPQNRGIHTLEMFTFAPLRRLDGRRVVPTDDTRETPYRQKFASK